MELLDIATSHASGEEAVGAIFNRPKGKAKRDEDAGEGFSNRPNKKKNKQRRECLLVVTFEVVGFHGTYHAILGRPCFAKFMAVPNYTYLKLKMPGPCGVITIDTSFQRAYECKVECCEHATIIIASKELTTIRKEVVEEAPDPKRLTGSFE